MNENRKLDQAAEDSISRLLLDLAPFGQFVEAFVEHFSNLFNDKFEFFVSGFVGRVVDSFDEIDNRRDRGS